MAVLTPEQRDRLTKLMDARFAREIGEIRTVAERMRGEREEAVAADWVDVALADTALAADDAVIEQDVQDVRDIIAARARLAAGTYGICIDCGEAIAYERLLAYPTAKRCIQCQRRYEQAGALRGMPLQS